MTRAIILGTWLGVCLCALLMVLVCALIARPDQG
jgi:putative Ca2+/H+ antiporter (TMEM165/GDT1 family)